MENFWGTIKSAPVRISNWVRSRGALGTLAVAGIVALFLFSGVGVTMAATGALFAAAPEATLTPTPSATAPGETVVPTRSTPSASPSNTRTIPTFIGEDPTGLNKEINSGFTGVKLTFSPGHMSVYIVGWTSGEPDAGWRLLSPNGQELNAAGWTCKGDPPGTLCPISDELSVQISPMSDGCRYNYPTLIIKQWGYDMAKSWTFDVPAGYFAACTTPVQPQPVQPQPVQVTPSPSLVSSSGSASTPPPAG